MRERVVFATETENLNWKMITSRVIFLTNIKTLLIRERAVMRDASLLVSRRTRNLDRLN